mmetsp:Transcript_8233/g.18408  ORF Transcript_8233/g.18408 Transcript_8233/m.18408 type:complete len:183 (-) Transcript_8233:78-626(-)
MPPVRYKAPLPVRFKVPKGKIEPLPFNKPDVRLGKHLVAAEPHRVTSEQIEQARTIFRRKLGRRGDFLINIHATYATTKKPDGVGAGAGKGNIEGFVARVPAGQAMFSLPSLVPIPGMAPNLNTLRQIADHMPMATRIRVQNNRFPDLTERSGPPPAESPRSWRSSSPSSSGTSRPWRCSRR